MTLILETESHGEVESGFFSTFTQFARLGEYSFATRHLCELAQFLAENENVKQTRILGYDVEKFYEKMGDYCGEIMQMVAEANESYLPELHKMEMQRQLEENQGKISLEDEIDMNGEGKVLLVKVNDDSIEIGEYVISSLHFGRYALYLAGGGFLGWLNDENKPEFADPTIEAIKKSKNPLYRRVQEETSS